MRVAFGLDLVVDFDQLALLVDNEGRTTDPHVGSTHELAFAPGAVKLAQLALGIDQQVDLESVLGDELLVLRTAVLADAENDGIDSAEIIDQRGKVIGLNGTTRCVILGIEVKHDVLFAKVLFQADAIAILVGRVEAWCGLVDFEHAIQIRKKKCMIKEEGADIKALAVRL